MAEMTNRIEIYCLHFGAKLKNIKTKAEEKYNLINYSFKIEICNKYFTITI